jgi:PAS domain S-box-containing protein
VQNFLLALVVNPFPEMKISKRFIFVPVLLILFSYLFYSAYKDVKDRTFLDFKAQQFALAKQASRGIEGFFIYYQRELKFLSNLSYISRLNDQGKKLLEDFYSSHSDQIEAITIVDSKGILIYTVPYNKSVIGQDISDQEHIKSIKQTHQPTVSEVFNSVQGFQTIAFHIPIMVDSLYTGSIAILIPLEKLGKRYIETIKTKETGFGWLMSRNGAELYHPVAGIAGNPVKEIYKDSPDVLDLIDRSGKDSEGTSLCAINFQNEKKQNQVSTIATFYRVSLGNTFWTILIFTPEKEVYKTLKSFRNRLYILSLFIAIVIITYFYLSFKASAILKEEKKRKALENVLKESEERFRVIFELSPAGIILIDKHGTIMEVNSSFCSNLGYSRDEIIGKNIRLFAMPEKENEIEHNIQSILSGKTLRHEINNIKKDGTKCVIAIYETMILLPDGQPGILSVSNDITDKKTAQIELIKAKDKAEESDRLKSAFLANISHELRTPLNAIIGFSNIMADNSRDTETVTNSNIIYKSGLHLLSLVEDIFDTAMIETGQIKIINEKTDINAILQEVNDIIKGEILKENKQNVELILNIKQIPGNRHIITDSRKLKQVLINLLRNSLKFTDKGFIEFGVSETNDNKNFVKFFVKDTGIGIDKKNHEIIFNTFRQIDDAHTRRFSGMGIGLSISKKLVEKLGGKIWVESEKGAGSVFCFTIPDSSDLNRQNNLASNDEVEIKNDFNKKTILVTEDEESNYNLLKILLTRLNINVLWAKNGIEAVDLCKNHPEIDLVLMDVKLPLMSGYDSTVLIKEFRPELPIIAQTAYATSIDKENAIKSGCNDYLSKPIQKKLLYEILNKYL